VFCVAPELSSRIPGNSAAFFEFSVSLDVELTTEVTSEDCEEIGQVLTEGTCFSPSKVFCLPYYANAVLLIKSARSGRCRF